MKRTFQSLSKWGMIAFSCLLAMSVASCGDDDNNEASKPKPTATTATVQPAAYMETNLLKYFDLYMVDSNGDSTKITLDNTEVVQNADYGSISVTYRRLFKMTMESNNMEMRIYKHNVDEVKNFPTSLNYKLVGKANGIKPSDSEKVNLAFLPEAKFTNNTNSEWDRLDVNTMVSTSTVVSGSKWDAIMQKMNSKIEHTIKLNFNSAVDITGDAY